MKKILSLLIGALMLFSISGCGNTKKATEEENKKIELNVENDIKTDNGEYKFTITGAEKTDWWKRFKENEEKEVILLKYECENVSFSDGMYNGLFLNSSAFEVTDQDGYILEECDFVYENNNPEVLSKGTKARFGIPYIAEPGIKSIIVKFKRGGEVTIPIS